MNVKRTNIRGKNDEIEQRETRDKSRIKRRERRNATVGEEVERGACWFAPRWWGTVDMATPRPATRIPASPPAQASNSRQRRFSSTRGRWQSSSHTSNDEESDLMPCTHVQPGTLKRLRCLVGCCCCCWLVRLLSCLHDCPTHALIWRAPLCPNWRSTFHLEVRSFAAEKIGICSLPSLAKFLSLLFNFFFREFIIRIFEWINNILIKI